MINAEIKQHFKQRFGEQVKFDELLSRHTTFKIGGAADIYLEPKTIEDLEAAFAIIRERQLPYFILGGGSNVLMTDEGFRGVVLHPKNNDITISGDTLVAGAGAVLAKVASVSAKAGLTGLEWGIAVPGCVGGAVRGNAGAFGGEIKDTLVSAEVFDGKTRKTLSNKELEFSYRTSRIKQQAGKEIVLSATFRLQPANTAECVARTTEMLKKKYNDQPMGERCAGCLFKNIEVDGTKKMLRAPSKGEPTDAFHATVPTLFWEKGIVPAGWLIEQVGMKGYCKGQVKVSEKHANFIVNMGQGSAAEIKDLAQEVKDRVYTAFGVHLEEEVEIHQ